MLIKRGLFAPARQRRFKQMLGVALSGAFMATLVSCALPPVQAYPFYGPYGSSAGVTAEANKRSAALEQYVKDWMAGKVSATVPSSLIPEASRANNTFTLQTPAQVDPSKQWVHRAAHAVNWQASIGQFGDPKASYLFNPLMLVPFGSKVIMTGQFPHSRYFSVQPSPSFKPENYRYGYIGEGEVSYLDADINPDAGSTNPFRVAANRNATSRNYNITCDVTVGDPKAVDAASWNAPDYRNNSNNRKCSGMVFRGPFGDTATGQDKLGLWDTGNLWIRYYAPDKSAGVFGGVSDPKVLYQLPDGRQYYIWADLTTTTNNLNATKVLGATAPTEPTLDTTGQGASKGGWDKMMGIDRSVYGSLAHALNSPSADPKAQQQYVRDMTLGSGGRGETVNGIGKQQPHATAMVHGNYLNTGFCIGAGKVLTIAGTLPTTPRTRNGETTMTAAQARYWSLTTYSNDLDTKIPGADITSIMDDEIVTNAQNQYILMYGRAADRPANATAANGITWVDWGPQACAGFTLRWIAAGPEWSFNKTPNEVNTGWAASWASTSYNPNLIGMNNRNGFLGAYQPVKTYLTTSQFAALGANPNPLTLPPF